MKSTTWINWSLGKKNTVQWIPQTYMRAGISYTDRTGDSVSSRFQKPTFIFHRILGSFTEIAKKVPITFVMYVRLSVRMYQRGSHSTDFREIWYWELSRKSVDKLQIWLKSDKSIRHFTWRPKYIYTVDSSTKYGVHGQQCKEKLFCHFHDVLYCWQLYLGQQQKMEHVALP